MKKTNPFKMQFRVTESQQVSALRRSVKEGADLLRREKYRRLRVEHSLRLLGEACDHLRSALAESERKRKMELVGLTVAYLAGAAGLMLMGAFQ